MPAWDADPLGDDYTHHVIDLGDDPDGEGEIVATLVRRTLPEDPHHAVLYVHGFSDYFFQTDLANFFAERGIAFFALDLRKCGRSRRPGQTAHYVSDLKLYDAELTRALAIIREETGNLPVIAAGHSTGGLILPLWFDRMNTETDGGSQAAGLAGLILNSPWFDLQGKEWMRTIGTQVIRATALVQPKKVLDLKRSDAYGQSVSITGHGTWEFDLAFKPMHGFDVTFGWLNAIRRGHARLHEGLKVGVPSLVLHSDKSYFSSRYSERVDRADAVLDVHQIARWSGYLGGTISVIPVPDGRHDLFLSLDEPRAVAYDAVDAWLTRQSLTAEAAVAG